MFNRRTFIAGAGSLAFMPARAEEAVSPVAHGVLANNVLAKAFEAAPAQLPDVDVLGPGGMRNIAALKGKTLIVPIWAEWCAPCLSELQDFAGLQRTYGNDTFAVIPILSGTRKRMTPDDIAKLFAYLHADGLEPLIENHYGGRLLSVMARNAEHETEIPCNLLIAPDGRVVGREFGLQQTDALIAKNKHQMLVQAESGTVLSQWGKDAGAEFAAAMAKGFLS